jgi:spermidine synthase
MNHFNESVYAYGGQWLSVDEPLYAGRTEFQDMLLFRNRRLGVVLVLDGVVQLTERDEFAYSEVIAHVPLFAHPRPARVLIVGGGDLCVLEEVLRHPQVERVTLVDLDGAVVEACKVHFVAAHRDAWRDSRVDLRVGDGAAHVHTTRECYDVILVDGPDPIVPGVDGCPLYAPAFFADCRRVLRPGGLLATQCDVPFHHPESLRRTAAAMRGSFPTIAPFVAAVPCFHGGFAAFFLASPDLDAPLGRPVRAPESALAEGLAYYTPELHRAAFAVPPYVRAAMESPPAV